LPCCTGPIARNRNCGISAAGREKSSLISFLPCLGYPIDNPLRTGTQMPKPNYSYEKRQKELAKKQKKEEKQQRKNTSDDSQGEEPMVHQPDQPNAES
jgi:hypothetical protein